MSWESMVDALTEGERGEFEKLGLTEGILGQVLERGLLVPWDVYHLFKAGRELRSGG